MSTFSIELCMRSSYSGSWLPIRRRRTRSTAERTSCISTTAALRRPWSLRIGIVTSPSLGPPDDRLHQPPRTIVRSKSIGQSTRLDCARDLDCSNQRAAAHNRSTKTKLPNFKQFQATTSGMDETRAGHCATGSSGCSFQYGGPKQIVTAVIPPTIFLSPAGAVGCNIPPV